jgi:flagellin-like protein
MFNLNNRKAISPVVATALLLVVAVLAVVGFSGWFTTFSSGMFVDIEKQTTESGSVSVEGLVGENLYLNSKRNSLISSIKINNIDCNFNGSILGFDSINVSSCIENLTGTVSIVVVTENEVIESYKYVDSSSNLDSIYEPSMCYNSSFVNTTGTESPCLGMLIVDRSMLVFATVNNPINSGEDYYINFEGINYTFGNSSYNVFTGQVTDMNSLLSFENNFNSKIFYWDVSNVINLSNMFLNSRKFNQSINAWDVSNVEDISNMFQGFEGMYTNDFNQPLNNWNVSNVKDMSGLFFWSNFNQPLDNWDVSSVEDMERSFGDIVGFNQNLSNWNVSSVKNMEFMFSGSGNFNYSINSWDVSNVGDMSAMFMGSGYNLSLNSWNVSTVLDMGSMFAYSSFNQNISMWDVDQVTTCAFFNTSADLIYANTPNFTSCTP